MNSLPQLSRRRLIALLGLAACSPARPRPENPMPPVLPTVSAPASVAASGAAGQRMPAVFFGHGAPTRVLDAQAGHDFIQWGKVLPRPRAVLVVSAHWESGAVQIGTTTTRELIYDFYGFPDEMYRVRYDAPVAADLAPRVQALLRAMPQVGPSGVTRADSRGWDHGVWTALMPLFPQADVPVLQISLPSWSADALLRLGRELAPLRDEGVLILASGNATHNLGRVDFQGRTPPPSWAVEFDTWLAETSARRDWDTLADAPNKAPAFRTNHPSVEHWTPILVAAGAGGDAPVTFPVTGWEFGSLSRRSLQLG